MYPPTCPCRRNPELWQAVPFSNEIRIRSAKAPPFRKMEDTWQKITPQNPKPGLGLGPGSSSQYSMYWLRHMPVHWTRPVHWCFLPPWLVRGARRRRPRRAPLEAPCRRRVFMRFGFTRAKKYLVRRFWTVSQRQFGGRLTKEK